MTKAEMSEWLLGFSFTIWAKEFSSEKVDAEKRDLRQTENNFHFLRRKYARKKSRSSENLKVAEEKSFISESLFCIEKSPQYRQN